MERPALQIIFDFNGTMLFDSALHQRAWAEYMEDLTMKPLSDTDISAWIAGRTPREILEHFIGDGISHEMVRQFSEEKEQIYRRLFMASDISLAPGLPGFLDYLSRSGIPLGIATTADRENMHLYYERFGLEKWIPREHVAFPDGTLRMKPFPDLYLRALEKLQGKPENTLVFEDSSAGAEAAARAGVSYIMGVTGDSWNMELRHQKNVFDVIRDYNDLGENYKRSIQL